MRAIDPATFAKLIVGPALQAIGLWSPAALELVLGTALQESGLEALVQEGGGPALGFFQMEPPTHDDIWANFLIGQSDLATKLDGLLVRLGGGHDCHQLVGNAYYAAAMCRIDYRRIRAPLPAAGDVRGQAQYWKTYYNTGGGKGEVDEFVANWNAAFPHGFSGAAQ